MAGSGAGSGGGSSSSMPTAGPRRERLPGSAPRDGTPVPRGASRRPGASWPADGVTPGSSSAWRPLGALWRFVRGSPRATPVRRWSQFSPLRRTPPVGMSPSVFRQPTTCSSRPSPGPVGPRSSRPLRCRLCLRLRPRARIRPRFSVLTSRSAGCSTSPAGSPTRGSRSSSPEKAGRGSRSWPARSTPSASAAPGASSKSPAAASRNRSSRANSSAMLPGRLRGRRSIVRDASPRPTEERSSSTRSPPPRRASR